MKPKIKAASDIAPKKNKQQTQTKIFIKSVLKILLILTIILACVAAGILGGAVVGYIKTANLITPEQLTNFGATTYIYDSNDNVIAELTGKENINRAWVKFDEVPDNLKNAFVAIEDERFYKHHGIDVQGLIRAVFKKITHPSSPMAGASTITQQMIKTITGNDKRSVPRKIQEQYMAIQLEKKMEKWQILEVYMNVIYMGYNYYGVQSASKAYFNKDVGELDLAQCAALAGITNNPSLFNPFTENGRKNLKKRQTNTLDNMLKLGYITKDQYDQAINEPLEYAEKANTIVKVTSSQSYFVDQVIQDVKKELVAKGYSDDMATSAIYNGGLKIHTTMDPYVQKAMDDVFTNTNYFPANKNISDPNLKAQGAMVIVEPKTGQVKALYGGSGEKNGDMILNRATQISRHPGSSLKPLAVYGPAINEKRITPATVIDDAPVHMLGNDKERYPENYTLDFQGLTTIRDAIRNSLNVVAAKIYRDVLGTDLPLQYLKKVGIDLNQKNVSVALGAIDPGVSPLQMASAYTVFANRGVYLAPYTFTKVEDSEGRTLLEKKASKPTIVFDEAAAYIMTDMLKGVCANGTAAPYGIIKNEKGEVLNTAGKTGTTSDNRDKWFVGFTPDYIGAVWYGYDKNLLIPQAESSQALIIWHDVMTKIHSKLPANDFQRPANIVEKTVCIESGKVPSGLCRKDPRNGSSDALIRYGELFIKGTEPKDSDVCDVHVSAKVCTESTDAFGRALLAGLKCPQSSVVEQVFVKRKVPYVPVSPNDPYPLDWVYELPTESCTVHNSAADTKNTSTKDSTTPSTKGSTNDTTKPSTTKGTTSQTSTRGNTSASTQGNSPGSTTSR